VLPSLHSSTPVASTSIPLLINRLQVFAKVPVRLAQVPGDQLLLVTSSCCFVEFGRFLGCSVATSCVRSRRSNQLKYSFAAKIKFAAITAQSSGCLSVPKRSAKCCNFRTFSCDQMKLADAGASQRQFQRTEKELHNWTIIFDVPSHHDSRPIPLISRITKPRFNLRMAGSPEVTLRNRAKGTSD